ncbi:hypothetical protein [Streptomyces olivochromogenes]|uniref:hypothetical protein n=1 Tax=Streptomyces olivochromogenes TaxID=1963 RepID=UPI000BB778E5|nr:hypothetical protein [Streptomyces olivochromogenes]
MIYELAESRDLPIEVPGEDATLRYRLRAMHRLHDPENAVDRASDEEVVALFRACSSARDRLIILLPARAALRRSEAAGPRRSDLHLLADNRSLGCSVAAAHLHVIRRQNCTRASANVRHVRPQQTANYLLVILFRSPVGSPLRPGAVNELTSVFHQASEHCG